MSVLLSSERADLQFNPETNSIELIWKKIHNEATYKTMFMEGVKYLKEYQATGWLSDIRKEGIVAPANSKWLQTEVIPKAISHGLKKIAIVMDSDIFKKFYVGNIEGEMGRKGINIMKYFDSLEKANEWLKQDLVSA